MEDYLGRVLLQLYLLRTKLAAMGLGLKLIAVEKLLATGKLVEFVAVFQRVVDIDEISPEFAAIMH